MDNELIPINLPFPPKLVKALGYDGNSRFIAVWWEPGGDEVWITDGRVGETGEWSVFLSFTEHPRVAPMLSGYTLGSSECEAEYAFLIDQQEKNFALCPRNQVNAFLDRQWPKAPIVEISPAQLEKALEILRSIPPPKISMEEVERRMDENYALEKEVIKFLDQSLKNN